MPATDTDHEASPTQIEPARIDTLGGDLPDLLAEVVAKAEGLGRSLHPTTAANLADLVRLMNTYYSNLIEGHNTRPRDIERALAGARDEGQRDFQQEAVAHYRLQERIDRQAVGGTLPDPADPAFLCELHRDFYLGASPEMLTIGDGAHSFVMVPGEWRSTAEHDVAVGRHLPPPSAQVAAFMDYFHLRYAFDPAPGRVMQGVGQGKARRILAMATAHHRFNWIHPFPRRQRPRQPADESRDGARSWNRRARPMVDLARARPAVCVQDRKVGRNTSNTWPARTSPAKAIGTVGAICRSLAWRTSRLGS